MLSQTDSLTSLRPLFLVVDDNADSADSLATLLVAWGCQAVAAYDGPRAIELADVLRPDAVLLDLCMPGTTGFETCRALRRLPWGAETTIVAVTGSAEEQNTALSDAGFDGVFAKPIESASLRALLDWMKRRRSAPGADPTTTHELPRFTASVDS